MAKLGKLHLQPAKLGALAHLQLGGGHGDAEGRDAGRARVLRRAVPRGGERREDAEVVVVAEVQCFRVVGA